MFPIAVLDGTVVRLDELKLADFIGGYLFGAGLFETMRIIDRRAQFLGRHVARLQRGLAALSAIEAPARLALEDDIAAGLERCRTEGIAPDVVRVTVSDGRVLVTFRDATPPRPLAIDQVDSSYRASDDLLNHKTIAYLKQYRRLRDGVVFQNERGELCETPTANLFVAFADRVVTPPLSAPCLPGIVREVLLERGSLGELPVREEPIAVNALATATAAWVTNSVALAIPVTSSFGRALPDSVYLAARAREAVCLHDGGGS